MTDAANGSVVADAMKWQLSIEKQNVVLSDDPDGTVCADAIKWEPCE